MTKPMVKIHNTETNEVIDREMNDAEFADYKITLDADEARKAVEAKAATAKAAAQAKLAALGLTTDDLKALGL